MNANDLAVLTLWLAREVARLHGQVASLHAVVEELRVVDRRLDGIDAAQIQVDSLQEFYEHLEAMNPQIAALVDDRPPRALDVDADIDSTFPE
ncbi:hypothetical protein HZ994_09270 [Akkermansiaceae bacterium]|nr:hypothetical protein HZ994_09270 [Akkermansiaceae bacterium]